MEPFDDGRLVPDAVERIAVETTPSDGLVETPLDAVEGVPRAALRQGTMRLDKRLSEPDVLFEATRTFTPLYRTPVHMFFAASPDDVESVLGSPPALLGSWEPVSRASRLELDAVYREREDVDPVAAGVAPPAASDLLVLAIGCTHATELSWIGFHDHAAAQAFVLSAMGYGAREVATLLSTSTAAAADLVAEGWETMRRIKWIDTVSEHLLGRLDPHGPALAAREGRTYRDPTRPADDGDALLTYERAVEADGRTVHELERPDGTTVELEFAAFTRLVPADAGDGTDADDPSPSTRDEGDDAGPTAASESPAGDRRWT
jgi:hypothetical protein